MAGNFGNKRAGGTGRLIGPKVVSQSEINGAQHQEKITLDPLQNQPLESPKNPLFKAINPSPPFRSISINPPDSFADIRPGTLVLIVL